MIRIGHALDVLQAMAREGVRVQCIVTSPPYWGLRKYDDEQEQVWGGDAACEHVWGAAEPRPGNAYRNDKGKLWDGANYQGGVADALTEGTGGAFCQRCGAWRGALGLEPTPAMYCEHMVSIFRAARDVLADDGVLWCNMGDSYAGGGRGGQGAKQQSNRGSIDQEPVSVIGGLKPRDLVGVPGDLARALRADGWWWRSTVVWAKPNPMPESVAGWRWQRCRVKVTNNGRGAEAYRRGTVPARPQQDHEKHDFKHDAQWADCPGCVKCRDNDGYVLRRGSWRPTKSYEVVLMLTKSARYFCDGEAVREPAEYGRRDGGFRGATGRYINNAAFENSADCGKGGTMSGRHPATGRNMRDVWTFPTEAFPQAHFATFPQELARRCILASTSERGHCPKCGARWARVVERSGGTIGQSWHNHQNDAMLGQRAADLRAKGGHGYKRISLGWRPTCKCGLEPVPDVVLDPFAGSGTTLLVARKLGRGAIGIDLSKEYARMARERLGLLAEQEE